MKTQREKKVEIPLSKRLKNVLEIMKSARTKDGLMSIWGSDVDTIQEALEVLLRVEEER